MCPFPLFVAPYIITIHQTLQTDGRVARAVDDTARTEQNKVLPYFCHTEIEVEGAVTGCLLSWLQKFSCILAPVFYTKKYPYIHGYVVAGFPYFNGTGSV